MSRTPGAPWLWACRLSLIAAMLVFSAVWSQRAPLGGWTNEVFGTALWGESDPGGYYLASAHELGWGESPLYYGHPGATLTPMLLFVQVALHRLLAEDGVSFTRFTVQHLPLVFLVSKLLVTGLHVLSLLVLLRLARAVLGDGRAAELAVLGYATSLPVLYFLSRISVEPLMVTFFAASLLAVFRWEERAREARAGPALSLAAWAGAASVAGALTKLSFLGPLPFFCALQIAAAAPDVGVGAKGRALAAFGVSALATLGLFSPILDWREFWSTWATITALTLPGGFELTDLLPALDAERIFLASEVPFLVCAALGVVGFLRHPGPGSRRRAAWLLAYGALATAVFGYRVYLHGSFLPFHYFFLSQATLAVFFGAFAARLTGRLGGWRGALVAVVATLALHGVALAAVVDSRRADARAYATLEPAWALVAQLGPRERIGVENPRARLPQPFHHHHHGFNFPMFFEVRPSRLQGELEALFVRVPPGSTASSESRRPALDTLIAIVPEAPAR